jgi:vacuolar-type H+-ATPase subunit C/Vma6
MELLQRFEDRGYPEEYLVARIRGRGSRFIQDWDGLVFSPDPVEYLRPTDYGELIEEHSGEGAWMFLARELKWLHTQMNNRLKDIFDPFFMYIEVETLIMCFRYKYSEKEGPELEEILRYSLLSNKIKEIILMSQDMPELLEELDKRAFLPSGGLGSLKDLFFEDGLQGLEQGLNTSFLETIENQSLHPELRDFFLYTIDHRNMNAVYKCLRWGIKTEPYLIREGMVGLSRLRKVFYDNSMPEFERIVFNVAGLSVKEATPAGIDNTLQKGLAKRLKTAGRMGSDIGLILNYLWECYMEAHDLSTVLYGREINRDLLREELIH